MIRSLGKELVMQVNVLDEKGEVRPLADIEQEVIRAALETCGGHITKTARALGIGRTTLYRKIALIEVESPAGE